jgi:hypothetical protein
VLSGIGIVELLIIIAVALALFGAPAIVAFWLGYRAGSKRSAESVPSEMPAEKPEDPAALTDGAPDEEETES